jgi:hypothetical protein
MEVEEVEEKLPKSFLNLHEVITKILKDNDILPSKDEEQMADYLQLIVKTVMKLQNTLIVQNTSNQEEIKSVIRSMKPEIANIFGPALQK